MTTLRGHGNTVYAASFSPDESRVVTASADETARLWDAGTGKPAILLPVGKGIVADLAVDRNPAHELVAVAGIGNIVQLWDVGLARRAQRVLPDVRRITSIALSPDGKFLAATTIDGARRVVDLKSRR